VTSTEPDRPQDQDAGRATAPALDEQLDAVSRTAAALREDGPPPQHITVRAADVSVELSWPGPAAPAAPASADPPLSATEAASQNPQADPSPDDGPPDQLSIRATVVGTFYRAPEPGAEPFASEGDIVQPGQQVAILAAMKMMLPVEATAPGKITSFLVGNGDPVEFDTPLVALSPAGA
jgi:acetyl-CoA carboxylase biotin carboxyl carrier protein